MVSYDNIKMIMCVYTCKLLELISDKICVVAYTSFFTFKFSCRLTIIIIIIIIMIINKTNKNKTNKTKTMKGKFVF